MHTSSPFSMSRFIVATLVFASGWAAATEPDPVAEIEARLKSLYPSTRITAVRASEVTNLYEVTMGRNVAFTDTSGRYFIFGHLFDMREQTDLTAQRLAEINRIDFARLPLADAIKTVKGNGSRRLAVFSDPDCPYCKSLERELDKLDNVTVHTFLLPLEGLHPDAKAKAERIWCSPDRAKAWAIYMGKGTLADSASCPTPIQRIAELASTLGINGTPTLILGDGSLIPGVVSAAELDRRLNGLPVSAKVGAGPRVAGQ